MKYLEENKATIISDLMKCLSFESVAGKDGEIGKALDFVLARARQMGMKAEKLLDGRVGVVEAGEGKETLGILVHIDVVGAGDRQLWRSDPFAGTLAEGRIYGRGALDDKGPLIVCLHAMKAAMEEEKSFTKKVSLIIGTQEETEWSDMEAYVASYALPDYGFTPDGEFPVCNIEKGCFDAVIEFALGEQEPQGQRESMQIKKIKAGTAANIVPGQCSVWLADGSRIDTYGKTAHSSRPEKGENAILLMAEKLQELKITADPLAQMLQMIKRRFADIYGSGISIYSKNEYYNGEFIHRNVVLPTMLEADRNSLKLTLNVRFSYESTEAEILAAIERFCREEGGRLQSYTALPAIYVDRNEPFLKKLAEAYETETGLQNEFSLAYGGSYAKAMKRMVSWGPVLPGMEDRCHEENEYISIDDLCKIFRIYYKAIIGIAKADESFIGDNNAACK